MVVKHDVSAQARYLSYAEHTDERVVSSWLPSIEQQPYLEESATPIVDRYTGASLRVPNPDLSNFVNRIFFTCPHVGRALGRNLLAWTFVIR